MRLLILICSFKSILIFGNPSLIILVKKLLLNSNVEKNQFDEKD